MTRNQYPDKRWQLQEVVEADEQWKLLDSEQELDERWQLQPDQEIAGNYGAQAWQPIDYAPEERSGGNWLLPSLVLFAVLTVAGYMAWAGLEQFGINMPDFSTQTAPESSDVASAVPIQPVPDLTTPAVDTPAPSDTSTQSSDTQPNSGQPNTDQPATDQPTATEPTPTSASTVAQATIQSNGTQPPADTASAMVEMRTATVKVQYGINARPEPSTKTDALQIISPTTQLVVWEEQENAEGKWLRVSLPDKTLAWVTADPKFVEVVSGQVTADEMNRMRVENGLEALATATPLATATAQATATPLATPTEPPTPTTLPTTAPTESNLSTAPITATATLTASTSVQNAITGTAPISSVASISSTPAISQSSDMTATTPTTSSIQPSGPGADLPEKMKAKIMWPDGANVRATPGNEGDLLVNLPFEATVAALGRSSSSAHILVRLEDGRTGWVLFSIVELSGALDELPIVN